MRLVKIRYRNPALDTEFSYCINNRLWRKDVVQIINDGTELLAPKYYNARHVGQLAAQKRANAKYRAKNPLKFIKKNHERKEEKKKAGRKKGKQTDRKYRFSVNVDATEYKMLWNFLYKEVRDPLKDKTRIQTIEEIIEKQERKLNER